MRGCCAHDDRCAMLESNAGMVPALLEVKVEAKSNAKEIGVVEVQSKPKKPDAEGSHVGTNNNIILHAAGSSDAVRWSTSAAAKVNTRPHPFISYVLNDDAMSTYEAAQLVKSTTGGDDHKQERKRVTMWNRVEQRKLSGNAAPFECNLKRYILEHPVSLLTNNHITLVITLLCDTELGGLH